MKNIFLALPLVAVSCGVAAQHEEYLGPVTMVDGTYTEMVHTEQPRRTKPLTKGEQSIVDLGEAWVFRICSSRNYDRPGPLQYSFTDVSTTPDTTHTIYFDNNEQSCEKELTRYVASGVLNGYPTQITGYDSQGFVGNTHGTRILMHYDRVVNGDVSDVTLLTTNSVDLDTGIPARFTVSNAAGLFRHIDQKGFTGTYWSASSSGETVYSDRRKDEFQIVDGRPVHAHTANFVDWISRRNVLMMFSIENSDSGQGICDDSTLDTTVNFIPACGWFMDAMVTTATGLDSSIFVARANTFGSSIIFTEGAIKPNGKFWDNTIFALDSNGDLLRSTSDSVAFAAGVVSKIAKNLASKLGREPSAKELKAEVLLHAPYREVSHYTGNGMPEVRLDARVLSDVNFD